MQPRGFPRKQLRTTRFHHAAEEARRGVFSGQRERQGSRGSLAVYGKSAGGVACLASLAPQHTVTRSVRTAHACCQPAAMSP